MLGHGVVSWNSVPNKEESMALSKPVLSRPGAGRTVPHGGGTSTEPKLAGEQSGGDWAVVEWRGRAGDEPPMHTHTREDETLYFLEGAITAYVGDETIEGETGAYAALPKDVPHGLSVRGEEVRLLVTLEPAGAEYFFVPATTPTTTRPSSASSFTRERRRCDCSARPEPRAPAARRSGRVPRRPSRAAR